MAAQHLTRRDYQRYARKGTTTQRGYGSPYRQLLQAALARWRPGDPCARCGQPMLQRWTVNANGKRASAIELDHTDDRTGYLGLSHRACNRRDGQAKTSAILRARGALTARQLQAIRAKQWQKAAARPW